MGGANPKRAHIRRKSGQMLQVRYYGDYPNYDSVEYRDLREKLHNYHIGSLVFGMRFNSSGPIRSSPLNAARVANRLQRDSKLPLLLAADIERGVASRLSMSLRSLGPWPLELWVMKELLKDSPQSLHKNPVRLASSGTRSRRRCKQQSRQPGYQRSLIRRRSRTGRYFSCGLH